MKKKYILSKSFKVFKVLMSIASIVGLQFIISCGPPDIPVTDTPGADFRGYPLVEVELNNTATTIDDYVFNTALTCRARLSNSNSFSSPIEVRLRNYNLPGYSGPTIQFQSSITTSFSNQALLNLPDDGSWASFEIIGDASNASLVDKDVVLEVIENRTGVATGKNVVLARKALMVTNTPPASVTPQLELTINGSRYLIDDYISLSPMPCHIRLINHASFSADLNVTLRNFSGSTGKLRFDIESSIAPVPHATVSGATVFLSPTSSTLNLAIPADGSSITFYVAGEYVSSGVNQGPIPSVKDKDAIIEVVDQSTSDVYGRWATMVRIRKNGNDLENEERDRFLTALAILNATFDGFETYIDIHQGATEYNHSFCLTPACTGTGIRQSPSFLPWHRMLLLRIEHDLQAIDPSVTIPYWKYNEAAPNIFSSNFMGRFNITTLETDIAMSNPLYTWSTGSGPDFSRHSNYNDQTESPTLMTDADHFTWSGSSVSNFSLFRQILESTTHGEAHNNTGALGGWIVNFYQSPTDPLFYMLHANVDRIWAKWQSQGAGRHEPELAIAFEPQGTFPSPPSGTQHIGSFLLDQMWPWNGQSGGGTLAIDDYPMTSYASFPIAPGDLFLVPAIPRPFDAIDYRVSRLGVGITAFPNKGLGYDYDDEIFVFNPSL